MKLLNDNEVQHCAPYNTANSAFLKNTISEGIFHWKFKIKKITSSYMDIGIWKINSGEQKLAINTFFTRDKNSGYAFCVGFGTLVNPDDPNLNPGDLQKYGKICQNGDIVEMILNLDDLTLKYIINDTDYGVAYNIEKTSYKAAIYMYGRGSCIQLLQ